MNREIKEKIEAIFQDKLTGEDIEELMGFLRETFIDSIRLDDEDPFFKSLIYEMKGEFRSLATLLSDFRSALKGKIHPDLKEIATKYIPQTSDHLEGVIETTEIATNKIMDNLEGMRSDIQHTAAILDLLKQGQVSMPEASGGDNGNRRLDDETVRLLLPALGNLEADTQKLQALISDSFVQMSFQDLTGQRIKKIINIIGQMEEKITRMIISFGIKLSEKEKNPDISRADLQKAVDEKVELLAGPQRAGEGMNQAEIDALLANL